MLNWSLRKRSVCTLLAPLLGQCLLLSVQSASEQIPQEVSNRGFCEYYTVEAGESALSIAQKFHVEYDDFILALVDCIGYEEGTFLQVGQKVCLPPYSPACRFVTEVDKNDQCKIYEVQHGDTLARVAETFNMNLGELASLNSLNLTTTVVPGMKLVLSWDESCPEMNLPAPSDAASCKQGDCGSIEQPVECQIHIATDGEDLNSISTLYNIEMEDLLQINPGLENPDEEIEPARRIYISLGSEGCEGHIHQEPSSEAVQVPVEVVAPSPLSPTSQAPASSVVLAPQPNGPISPEFSRSEKVVVDVIIDHMTRKEFQEKQTEYSDNMASLTQVPVSAVDIRFVLPITSEAQGRKLLSESLLKVDTAIFGNESQIYDNLVSSIENGSFMMQMSEDSFDILKITVVYPGDEEQVLFSPDTSTTETETGSGLPLPMGALIGIGVGGVVVIVLVASLCCYACARKRQKALHGSRNYTQPGGNEESRGKMQTSSTKLNLQAYSFSNSTGLNVNAAIPVGMPGSVHMPPRLHLEKPQGYAERVAPTGFTDNVPRNLSSDYVRTENLVEGPRKGASQSSLLKEDVEEPTADRHTETTKRDSSKLRTTTHTPRSSTLSRYMEIRGMRSVALALAVALGAATGVLAQTPVCPTYVVQPGDSLYSIQQKFDILSPDDLTNALLACGQQTDLLQIGQEICLPGADKPGCANVRSYNNDDNCKVYIVQQGDTIESVANSLDIYRDTLDNLNKDVQAGGILQPNKYLKLPPWSNQCGDPNKSGESCRLYIVNSGDFIAGIAAAYGVTVDDLLSVNPGLDANSVLQNSQPIKIPPFPASCGAGVPSKPPTDTVLKCRGYRVQQGDNIQQIAQAFKTTVNDITAVNPELSGGALVQPGTIVKIPPYDNTCDKPILVQIDDAGSNPPPSGDSKPVPVPVPVTKPSPVPVPVPVTNPSPVPVTIPSPSPPPPPSPSPSPEVVPTASEPPSADSPAPATAPAEEVVVALAPEVAPAPAPSSSPSLDIAISAAMGILALAFF